MRDNPKLIPCSTASPCRVLVVDDEPLHRSLECEILQPPQYRVTEAGSGHDALAAIRAERFDVVLLDKRMPGLDGDETCRRIRGELGESMLPVIMVTGNGGLDELIASLRAGATDFIRKPYEPMELVARVDAAASHKRFTDQLDSAESVLFALARMVEAKDEGTNDHCSRLSHNAVVFGQALGLDQEALLALRYGGVLHDIGKIGIPDSILLKRGPLSEVEWVIMRQHTVIGAHLCSELKSMRLTVPVIRSHHERFDGGGYPDGLKGEAIPLLARVFQIVDIYDALAAARPYKPAWPRAQIIATLEQEAIAGWRDPELMAAFLDILRHRPNDLATHAAAAEDLGSVIFDKIMETGALDWEPRVHAPQQTAESGS